MEEMLEEEEKVEVAKVEREQRERSMAQQL